MATRAERAVIEAARVMSEEGVNDHWTACAVVMAVEALKAEEAECSAAPPPGAPPVELDITWADLCSGDLMFSAKTGRWMEALEIRHRGAMTTVRLTGGEKNKPPITFTRPATTPVKVRRAADMAAAVDVLTIAFSGPGI